MKPNVRTTALAAALLLITASAATAVVLDEKSPAQKLRADVSNQLALYVKCLANVALACEKTGANNDIECNLATGTATPPADPRGTFATQIAKCDAKLDFNKKGPKGNSSVQNYELIGCPSYGSPTRLADMDAFEAGASFLKSQITGFVGNIDSASGCTDTRSCKTDVKILLDFYKGLSKCQTSCENDYKDKRGNGGPTDAESQCDGGGGEPSLLVCLNKVIDKYLDKAAAWPGRDFAGSIVFSEVDDLNDDLFNAPDVCN